MVSDTPADVQARLDAMYLARTPEQRLQMATGMFAAAKALCEQGIRHHNPAVSAADLHVAVARRLHGDDLSGAAYEAIHAYCVAHGE